MKNPSYALAVGKKSINRLDLLNEVYGSGSQDFLRKFEFSSFKNVLSVGCGTGNMEQWMARATPSGEICAVDISDEQIQVAKNRSREAGISNISFHQQDANALNFMENFDFCYCRLLLVHLKEPEEVIKKMISSIRQGGIIALEEMSNSRTFCYPNNKHVDYSVELIEKLGKKIRVDYNIGPKLCFYLKKLGVTNISTKISQPGYFDGNTKELLLNSIVEAKKLYIEKNICSSEQFNKTIKELRKINNNSDLTIYFAPMFQVWGRV